MPPYPLPLDRPFAVDVSPGGEIVVTGSCYVKHDGTRIGPDATHYPKDAPGGESTDPVGLVDAQASGLQLIARDHAKHEARYLYSGKPTEVCLAAGINGACVVPATRKLAVNRGLTMQDFLSGIPAADSCLTVQVPDPPPPPTPLEAAAPALPFFGIAAALGAAVAVGLVALRARKKRRESPTGQLLELARRVQGKLRGADAVLAAPLGKAVETALAALKRGRVDPASAEGKRVAEVLVRVETRLDSHAAEARAEQEREAADELVREVESALEAAEEASALGAKTRG